MNALMELALPIAWVNVGGILALFLLNLDLHIVQKKKQKQEHWAWPWSFVFIRGGKKASGENRKLN